MERGDEISRLHVVQCCIVQFERGSTRTVLLRIPAPDNLFSDLVDGVEIVPDEAKLQESASEYLLRTQVLLATLLPTPTPGPIPESGDKFVTLLPFGAFLGDQQFSSSTLDLAKPSARFGLLLVGGPES